MHAHADATRSYAQTDAQHMHDCRDMEDKFVEMAVKANEAGGADLEDRDGVPTFFGVVDL